MHLQLRTDQVASLLDATAAILRSEVEALPDEITRFRPAPGEWCVNEVIGHLIEAEMRGFAGRIRHILADDQHVCQDWDPVLVAAERQDHEKSTSALLDEFSALRAESIPLVLNLQPEELARSGLHPVVGVLHIGDLLHEWVHHDRNHLKQIFSNLQLYIWGQMGNAQKFS
jgi:hypothetical protein